MRRFGRWGRMMLIARDLAGAIEIRGYNITLSAVANNQRVRMLGDSIGRSPGCGRAGGGDAAHAPAAESAKADFVRL
jgi:hypothetical protein